MGKLFVLIVDDHHCEPEAYPYTTLEKAIEQGLHFLPEEHQIESINPCMSSGGWRWYATYGCDGGDCVRVIEVELDKEF